MKKYNQILLVTLLTLLTIISKAQNNGYIHLINNKEKLITDFRLYGGLLHQHQDFFNKAFSYQGIEAGAIINHQLTIGIFGACFASNLNIGINNHSTFINMKKAGLAVGQVYNDRKAIHAGWLINIGYFSLRGGDTNQKLFGHSTSDIKISGLSLLPEVYAELNIAKWMKFRTGIAYSFYNFEDQSVITSDDLQNVSVNFGFIFGDFR